MKLEEYAPGEIEKRSFAIIEEELGRELDPVQKPIIKRVIHTTADFSYADTLFFSEGAVEEGLNALRSGVSIVTDTNMGKAGINKKKLGQLGGSVHCFMADEDIAREAKERKCTRAVASMEKAVRLFGAPEGTRPCIFAIGNAPTALIRLYELVKEGRIKPSLIIGAPVGFVNVVQSKELVLTLEDTPYIVARGRKGGSNVAAAICNALLYQIK